LKGKGEGCVGGFEGFVFGVVLELGV